MLGHVADQLADPLALAGDVQVEHPRAAGGGGQQAEQDLDQRRLAGPVGADQPGHALGDLDVEARRGRSPGAVPLRQRLRDDEGRHLGTVAIIPTRRPPRLAVSRRVRTQTPSRGPHPRASPGYRTVTVHRDTGRRPPRNATSAAAPLRLSHGGTTRTSRRPSCSSRRSHRAPPPTSTPSPRRRAEPEPSRAGGGRRRCATTTATGCRDVTVTFRVTFPTDPDGDAAREVLPAAVQRSHDRLCTVGRTVELATPIETRIEG